MTKLTTASYVKITLIIALGLLILGSIGFGGCSAMRFKMMGGTEMGSANVDAASVKNLSVKWASGAVNIDVVDEGDAIELVETAPRGMTKAQQIGVDERTLALGVQAILIEIFGGFVVNCHGQIFVEFQDRKSVV